jgi:hypothetical protein
MKHQFMCREVLVAVTDGKLDFGTWERISMVNSMAVGKSGYWLKLLGSSLIILSNNKSVDF